ncbi:MAG: AMP-binding protein [Phycisphaerae bacterium]|nr:AMP-binding protein [Phycisphaerae bacterium]
MLRAGHLGVHPPGALGVAFYVHAGAECFIGRAGDGITPVLKERGHLMLEEGGAARPVPLGGRIFTNLLEADARGALPEVLLACCTPAQVPSLLTDLVRFVESLAERGLVRRAEDLALRFPIVVLLPNGILADQSARIYREQLTESLLLGRLPGLDTSVVDALCDRLVRGVAMQAGGRRGSGADTVYLRKPKGSIIFAGGGAAEQERVDAVLAAHDYPATLVRGVPASRIEFDKAMISIVLNVGGLIHTVRTDGELIDLRMGDLCKDESKAEFVARATRAVFDVGRSCGAYAEADSYDAVWAEHRATILRFADHVTSSLKNFRDALDAGLDSVALMPNEEWILTPLMACAARAGMAGEEALFRGLAGSVRESMARAIRRRKAGPEGEAREGRGMKLTAQRNIAIELFESGVEDLVLVGTMLDSDHLIKLELTIHLPDEQIVRSRLDMIRAPFPVCREVEGIADRLVGLRVQRGVLNEIAARIGGRVGCSHIKEIATNIIYFAASYTMRRRAGLDLVGVDSMYIPTEEKFRRTRELLCNSCLAYSQTTPLGIDVRMGIQRVGEEHSCAIPLGEVEPSLGVVLRERARRWGERVYIRHRDGDAVVEFTWNQFAHRVFQIARHLLDLGLRPGDRVATLCENRVEMYALELAVMSIGGVCVPIFAGYHAPQVAYVLRHARPRFLVVSGPHQLEKIERDRYPWIERVFCIDVTPGARAWGAHDLGALTGEGGAPPGRLETRVQAVKPQDRALIMYTSGTTGSPKGVCLAHRNLISQQKALSLLWDVTERDVFLSYLPWHHSFGGLFERLMTLYSGAELCLDDARGRDIERLMENWRTFRPTVFFSVPRVHGQVVAFCRDNAEAADLVFGGRLRFVFTAAAPLPAPIEAAYREHGVPVLEGWGLTETSPCVTVRTAEHPWRSGYVGFPIPGVSVRIGPDQQIMVKGPNVMEGYLDDEEATAHVIDADGWFHTGDLGEFTKDGLRILGRKDGAFKLTTGEMVHPQRVETTLVNESGLIGVAVTVGSGRDYVGALLFPDLPRLRQWAREHGVPENGALVEHPLVHELFAAELARVNALIEPKYARVRRAALADRDLSLDRGELTPSSKVVRKKVLEAFKDRIDALYEPAPASGVIEVAEPKLQGA